jgi:methionine aminotransferase
MFLTKLPNTGNSIFSVMTGLANTYKAINLAQGFPDFQPNPILVDKVYEAMKSGQNQYAPMPGLLDLRQELARKTLLFYKKNVDPETEITITAGATQAIFTAIAAFVSPDQEVICFDPAYDCYAPAIKVQSARPIHLPMFWDGNRFAYDWDQLRARINTRTRMVILNNPHNPTGAVLLKEDLDKLADLLRNTEIVVLADEVYEHMVFDKKTHLSMLTHPELCDRAIVVSSFGKTYHNTGWKVGYAIAPNELTKEFRKVHQFNVFAVNTPVQWAFAAFLKLDKSYEQLPDFYQQKRDLFLNLVKKSRFDFVPTASTYFQLARYNRISSADDMEFTEMLVREKGLAVIPISPFIQSNDAPALVRFCFAKSDETLQKAAEVICAI